MAIKNYTEEVDFKRLSNLSRDVLCIVGFDGFFRYINPAGEKTFGFTLKEVVDKPYLKFVHPGDRSTTATQMQHAMTGEEMITSENRMISKNGQSKHMLWNITVDRPQQLVYAAGKEVTEQKDAQATIALRDREILTLYRLSEIFHSPRSLDELYHEIVEEICSATGFPIATIAVLDKTGQKIVFRGTKGIPLSSDKSMLEASLDKTFSGVITRTGKPLVVTHAGTHPRYRSEVLQQIGAQTFVGFPLVVGQKIIGALGLAHPLSIEINEQTTKWIESLANYIAALTEQKRAEEELRKSHEQLRDLSMHLQSAVEEERKRIAREIHDELGQELSLLQLELGLVESELSAKQKETREKTRSMSKLIDSAIKSVQRISSDLRPTLLDNLGIGAAVEWQTKEFQRRTKIKCEVTVDPPEIKLDQDRSTAFFRILQEALTNIARHARATRVHVYLREQEHRVELTVRDNGIGISQEPISDSRSFGLVGMRERVYQFGGSVVISGKPGKGTQVSVIIPMQS